MPFLELRLRSCSGLELCRTGAGSHSREDELDEGFGYREVVDE